MSLEDLDWRSLSWVKDVPMIDAGIRYETKRVLVEKLPKHNIFIHCGALQL